MRKLEFEPLELRASLRITLDENVLVETRLRLQSEPRRSIEQSPWSGLGKFRKQSLLARARRTLVLARLAGPRAGERVDVPLHERASFRRLIPERPGVALEILLQDLEFLGRPVAAETVARSAPLGVRLSFAFRRHGRTTHRDHSAPRASAQLRPRSPRERPRASSARLNAHGLATRRCRHAAETARSRSRSTDRADAPTLTSDDVGRLGPR
jgi:hypothetical protein